MLAAAHGYHHVITALLSQRADANIRDHHNATALDEAAQRCHHRAVAALLAGGAAIDMMASARSKPLMLSIDAGCMAVSELLVLAGGVGGLDSVYLVKGLALAVKLGNEKAVTVYLTVCMYA